MWPLPPLKVSCLIYSLPHLLEHGLPGGYGVQTPDQNLADSKALQSRGHRSTPADILWLSQGGTTSSV